MKTGLLSIIVPSYNVEKSVQNTLESILNQTYTYFEIICVNDGSKDSTLKVLQEYSSLDKRVKVFTKENEGVTKAREYGFEQASGEYIGFVDADDIIEPTMYERLYNNLKEYNADISHCGYVIDYLDGTHEYFYNTGHLAQQDKISGIKSLISGAFEPGLCNKLYNHNLLQSLLHSGVMDHSIKMNEDLLMNYYLFKEADSSVLEDICPYHYTKREGSVTMSGFRKSDTLDRVKVKKTIYEDSIGTEYEFTATNAYLEMIIHSYNEFLNQNSSEYIEDMKYIRELLISHKSEISLLSRKYRLLTNTLVASPKFYSLAYKIFS